MSAITMAILSLFFLTTVFGQSSGNSLEISHLTDNFYVVTTYGLFKGDKVPANAMYLVTAQGVVLIDTPWDTTQFQPLLDSIAARHHKKVVLCLATHFHADRTAGLDYYRKQGIKTYTTKQTDKLSSKRGLKRAEFLINNDTVFTVGQYSFQTYYPGQGHTADNIVVWFSKERILYGGCLIKSVTDSDLGNLADGNVKEYARTLENVQRKYSHPKYIIPGHGNWSGTKSLQHTLLMALARRNARS
jgi:metallo-beta-lactamase class B